MCVCLFVCCSFLTSLDAGVVPELVAAGTLALQVSVGQGCGRGAVRADAGVPLVGLRQTQQAAGLVGTGVTAWWTCRIKYLFRLV